MIRRINYNHLHYFWVVAREGSVAKAAELLHLTPQTVSGQIGFLEEGLNNALFRRQGRSLVLTEVGQVVFRFADEIFGLAGELIDVLNGRLPGGPMLFTVGVADVVPKLVAYRILEPALTTAQPVRIVCREARLEELVADLSIHKLDMVLADAPLSAGLNVKAYNHFLGESGVSFFATEARAGGLTEGFPNSLHGVPLLMPGSHTALRRGLDQWLESEGVAPRVVGEFDDTALLKAFGQAGAGVFPAPTAIEREIQEQYGVQVVGRTSKVKERYYAISAERRLQHPAVVAVSQAARSILGPER
ncbi:MAG: transcriptional activator NhaR [Gammaproteobacteria bacterium]|jgi:LysR family transcriptional activator of nhaA|nr:transcriptional activator NhaR [Gammaproteobacteria bacterium]